MTRRWERGDRVYFVPFPELVGSVHSQDPDGVVNVDVDGGPGIIYALPSELEWFTRPPEPPIGTYLEISSEKPAFHYGYLQFFKHPERVEINRLMVNGRTSLEAA